MSKPHRHLRHDPLEETLENPDLPPVVAGRVELSALRQAAPRRAGWRIVAAVGVFAVVVFVAGARFLA